MVTSTSKELPNPVLHTWIHSYSLLQHSQETAFLKFSVRSSSQPQWDSAMLVPQHAQLLPQSTPSHIAQHFCVHPTHTETGISYSAVSDHQLKELLSHHKAQAFPRNEIDWNIKYLSGSSRALKHEWLRSGSQLWIWRVEKTFWVPQLLFKVFHDISTCGITCLPWTVLFHISTSLKDFPFPISTVHLRITTKLLGSSWKGTRFCGAGKHRWTLALKMQKKVHVEKA